MITQCTVCSKTGRKDVFCENCIKIADYFDVYKYIENYNNSKLVGRIKAYRWKDVLDFIKNSFLNDQSNIITSCEKDFAFVEMRSAKDNTLTGYKIYLNNSSSEDKISWNLT